MHIFKYIRYIPQKTESHTLGDSVDARICPKLFSHYTNSHTKYDITPNKKKHVHSFAGKRLCLVEEMFCTLVVGWRWEERTDYVDFVESEMKYFLPFAMFLWTRLIGAASVIRTIASYVRNGLTDCCPLSKSGSYAVRTRTRSHLHSRQNCPQRQNSQRSRRTHNV